MTPVLFPDTVALVVNYLRFELVLRGDGAVVSAGVRSPRPSRFVVVRRVGGTRTTVITDAVTVTVEAWAPTVQEAADLSQLCRALCFALEGTVQEDIPIYAVQEVGGPVDLPDPESKQPRYSFTHSILVRGASEGRLTSA